MPTPFNRKSILSCPIPGTQIKLHLLYPSDKDWADRARLHPVVRSVANDEISTTSIDTSSFDAALIKKLAREGEQERVKRAAEERAKLTAEERAKLPEVKPVAFEDPTIEPAIARRIVDRLDQAGIVEDECRADGGLITVVMDIMGERRVTFGFAVPSASAVDKYYTATERSTVGLKKRELRQKLTLEPGGEAFDRHLKTFDGYASQQDIPLNHKAAAASKLIELAAAGLEVEFEEQVPNG